MRLDGVTILDFTHLLPGPYATQLLADMGADVWKIEPAEGDGARRLDLGGGPGTLFSLVNRGKQSVTLDLKADGATRVLARLFEEADVVVEQFKPGVADRLGIDYESAAEHRPDVVYCSISGYGQDGPYSDRVGHDLNYVGATGILDMTRRGPDADPAILGVPIADMAGGVFAAMAILGGLLGRELGTGAGEYIDLSLTDVALSFTQVLAAESLFDGDVQPGRTLLTGGYPCYGIYETADEEYLTLAAIEPHFWQRLCDVLDRPEFADRHMAEEAAVRDEIRACLEVEFTARPAAEWEATLGDAGVPVGTVAQFDDAITHPQIAHRDMVATDVDPPRIGFPATTSDGLAEPDDAPPALGADTASVLGALDFGSADLAEFRATGLIPTE